MEDSSGFVYALFYSNSASDRGGCIAILDSSLEVSGLFGQFNASTNGGEHIAILQDDNSVVTCSGPVIFCDTRGVLDPGVQESTDCNRVSVTNSSISSSCYNSWIAPFISIRRFQLQEIKSGSPCECAFKLHRKSLYCFHVYFI